MVLWRRRNLHPPPGGSGTGSLLLHYFSTNRVDSRGLRRTPVDSTAADKRLHSNVLNHKLRIVSQLQKHARTGSTPAAPRLTQSSFHHATVLTIAGDSYRLKAATRNQASRTPQEVPRQ